MTTKLPRVNVTLDEVLLDILRNVAVQEQKSVSRVAKEMIVEAVSRREDMALSEIAKLSEISGKTYTSHEDAWN
jgi:hypothetical protein